MGAAFYAQTERPSLSDAISTFFGIKRYICFKDDICIVLSARRLDDLLTFLHRTSGPFKLKHVATSNREAVFMDLLLRTDPTHMRLTCHPYTKSTSLRVPLPGSSEHAPHVHANWPIGQLH